MITRISTLKRVSNVIVKQTLRRHASKSGPCRPAHMNELPVPCTPWAPRYKRKQLGYTAILLFGLGSFVAAFTMAYTNEALELNFFPPDNPAPPTPLNECKS